MLILVSVLAGIAISSKTKITGACNLLKAIQGKLQECIFRIILICLSTITIYNLKIWSFVRNHNRRIAQQNILPTDAIKARNIKLAKTVGALFVSYVIGYIFPVVFLGFNKIVTALPPVLKWVLQVLYISNHANNFIVFSFANTHFRNAVKKMFWGCLGCKNQTINRLKFRS